MFVLQHHLQHLVIGFECPSNPVSHVGYCRSNCPMEEISENEAYLSKYTFLSPFYFLSDMDSHEQANVKRKLTQKFGALAPYRCKSFCY